MEKKIEALIKDLKSQGVMAALGQENPKEEVNVWWVIARLQGILLEERK